MYSFLFKHYKTLIIIILLYLIFIIFKNILNIYTFLISIIVLIFIYLKNKKVFKKIAYKLLFKNKNIPTIKNRFGAATKSLKEINEINKKISNKINSEILNDEKIKLEKQLNYGDYNVTLFGSGSSGKTSLARALLKSFIGLTSPTIGTTKKINSYKIKIPILKRDINIIDTPGLFEASIKGEEREKETIIEASKSDLVLFILDQDINKYELFLIENLSEIGKKLIIVLNKCDLRSEKQNNNIVKNIISIESINKYKIPVVKTIAKHKSLSNQTLNSLKIAPDVGNLFKQIIEILDDNGEELLADNILFRCNQLGLMSKKIVSEQRDAQANKVINKYTWVTGGVILVNPIPIIDFITTTSVNVQMIIEISKIYDKEITKNEASELSKTLLSTLAKLGILKGGVNIITAAMTANFTTIIIAKSIQSITSGWLIRIVGLSINKYFKNGQCWGEGGINKVIEEIYKLNKREEILNNFIDEAIKKINIKNEKKLPRKLLQDYLED